LPMQLTIDAANVTGWESTDNRPTRPTMAAANKFWPSIFKIHVHIYKQTHPNILNFSLPELRSMRFISLSCKHIEQ